MSGADAPWSVQPDGLIVTVRLTPKGGRDAVDGIETLSSGQTVLKLRVRAAPMEGQANAALARLLGKAHRHDEDVRLNAPRGVRAAQMKSWM